MTFVSGDFKTLDINQDGYLDAEELKAANENISAWDFDKDGKVTNQEWEGELEEREITSEHQGQPKAEGFLGKGGTNFAAQTQFESEDFSRIDTRGDGSITRDEWISCNLDVRLFDLIAGQSGSISKNDWASYMEAQGQEGNTSYIANGKR